MVALPVPDDWADVVLSVFGVMYAGDQAAAAGELARVAAPGARVVLASWLPGSLLPAMGQVLSGYLPPPPTGGGPPSRWGDPGALKSLLEDSGLRLTATSVQRLAVDFPDAPAAADFLVRTAGHVVSEQQRLTDDGRWDDLRHDLVRFVQHRADPNSATLRLTLENLLATASKQPQTRARCRMRSSAGRLAVLGEVDESVAGRCELSTALPVAEPGVQAQVPGAVLSRKQPQRHHGGGQLLFDGGQQAGAEALPLAVRNDRESADLRHPRIFRRDAGPDRGDKPPAGVAPAQREDLRVGELGGQLGEGLPQRREVQVGVGLGLRDVRGALQGQHLAGVLSAEPDQRLHQQQLARHTIGLRETVPVIDVRRASASDGPVLARIDLATWTPDVSPAPPPADAGGYLFFGDRTKPSDVLVAELDGAVAGWVKVQSASPARPYPAHR